MAEVKEIRAEIISIGDELLIGQTINTNASWLGKQLALYGVRTTEVFTIPDDRQSILDHLHNAKADVVIITGGLGPTKDDITKKTLCEFFDCELVRDKAVEQKIVDLFAKFGREALEVNKAQADLPSACLKIPNDKGTATGMWFEKGNQVIISLPGVPYEMKGMMVESGLDKIQEHFKPPVIVHRTIQTTGMGESHLAERIEAWENSLQAKDIKLAYLPSPGIVKLRLSAYASGNREEAVARVDERVKELYQLIPDLIFGEGTDTLESVVGAMLAEKGMSLATAESCTGGTLAHKITSVPGSSRYYMGSLITYSNELKKQLLGVTDEALREGGAVSQKVVEQMALGAKERMGTHWALSTSGVAGPGGGSVEKPVGHVWLGIAGPGGVSSKLINIPGSRDLVQERSARIALNILREALKNA